jgi:RNA polymerase sigma-70 factor (ECF subfamily)
MLGSLVGDRVDSRLGEESAPAAGSVAQPAAEPAILFGQGSGATADADGYRELMEAHLDEAYRLASFILRHRADAEDAVHEAAISAWLHWSGRRDPARTQAWFRQIVVNACRDRIRGRGRVRAVGVGLEIESGLHPLVGDAATSFADREEIGEVLQRLDLDDRILISLRYGLDMTVPAIAGVLGLRSGTVKSRLHRAIVELRTALSGADR